MTNKNRLNNINSELNKLIGSKNNRKSSTMNKINSLSPSSNSVFIVIGIILLVIILCVIGYFLYNYFTNISKQLPKSKLLIPYIRDASVYKSFSNSSIPETLSGNEYNINMWLYINTYSYRINEDKCILFKGDTSSQLINDMDDIVNEHGNPSIWLRKNTNTLVVQVGLDTNFDSDSVDTDKIDQCEFKNFPLQKWVNLNVSMRNNVLDIFIDGTLVKSCILKGSPTINSGDLHVFNQGPNGGFGFNGYISRLEYTNKALNSDAIMDRYKKGPVVNIGSSFFNLSL
jgi:hypothetical protein